MCVCFLSEHVGAMNVCVLISNVVEAELVSLNGAPLLTTLIVERLLIELHYDAPALTGSGPSCQRFPSRPPLAVHNGS